MKNFILLIFVCLLGLNSVIAQTYTITAQCGNNGSITPSGVITVNHGDGRTFTFTPANSNFEIWQVLIDGSNIGAVSSYTFSNVTIDHTIQVSFKLKTQPTFSGGAGTEASPYLISSKADMVALANAVDGGTDYYGKYFLLTTDFTGANAINTSVGSYAGINGAVFSRYFNGIFNGNGHIIEMNSTTGGVFGYVESGTIIQYLGVKGTINVSVSEGSAYAGGICNLCYGTISHCYNTASISAYTSGFQTSACSYGISPGGTISNCYNFGNISATVVAPFSITFAGGICDKSTKSFAANASISTKIGGGNFWVANRIGGTTVNNCYALSTMSVNGATVSSTNANSTHGADATFANFQSQSWIQSNLGWDFTNVWKMSDPSSEFKGLPIFKWQAEQTQTYTITASSGSGGTISPSGTATVNYGENKTYYFYPNSGYKISQVVVDGSNIGVPSSYTFSYVTVNHTITVDFEPQCISNLIVQVWDDVLSVINEPANNGGYNFTEYQWLRNGEDIAGETQGNLYLNGDKAVAANYSCRMKTASGETVQTCEIFWSAADAASPLNVYPNPATDLVTVESSEIEAGDKIGVYSTVGILVRQMQAVEPNHATLDLSSLARGIYVVRVNGRQARVIKN